MNAEDHLEGSASTVADVIEIALPRFATAGYSKTKLEVIARESGMSKRMIHYHFGDKKGLYRAVLALAANRLIPPSSDMVIDSAVPVDGVRKIIDKLVVLHQTHPTELRLLVSESINPHGDLNDNPAVADFSALILHLSKLLIVGQDSGVFRPGISEHDICVLITSLTLYPVAASQLVNNLIGLDLHSPENQAGLHRLTVDAVLAFLTANIPNSTESSYFHIQLPDEDDDTAGIYGDDLDL
ncbi:MAG: TetR/AcrR family transcriptional regulator [Corynebacterium sp.]|nr:TetR/AcrR family transcriptional regulator [Corynebacterium sp.]